MRTMATLAAGVVLGAAGFLGAAPPCTPVAFVNINQVVNSYPRANKLFQDLVAEAKKSEADFQARDKEIQKAKEDLGARYDEGTPEYVQGQRKIAQQMFDVDLDKKATLEAFTRKRVTGLAAVYKEICAEAQRIAQARGYSSVVNLDPEPIRIDEKGQVMGVNDLKLQIALRTAIWADPAHDLTKDVAEALEKAK